MELKKNLNKKETLSAAQQGEDRGRFRSQKKIKLVEIKTHLT
jgi:hypothetical protein